MVLQGKYSLVLDGGLTIKKDGMERQLQQLSQLGLLSQFVGMLTDSRSFYLTLAMSISAVFYVK